MAWPGVTVLSRTAATVGWTRRLTTNAMVVSAGVLLVSSKRIEALVVQISPARSTLSATVMDTYRVVEKPILITNLTTVCRMAVSIVKTKYQRVFRPM
jgi:hypothetical protein